MNRYILQCHYPIFFFFSFFFFDIPSSNSAKTTDGKWNGYQNRCFCVWYSQRSGMCYIYVYINNDWVITFFFFFMLYHPLQGTKMRGTAYPASIILSATHQISRFLFLSTEKSMICLTFCGSRLFLSLSKRAAAVKMTKQMKPRTRKHHLAPKESFKEVIINGKAMPPTHPPLDIIPSAMPCFLLSRWGIKTLLAFDPYKNIIYLNSAFPS